MLVRDSGGGNAGLGIEIPDGDPDAIDAAAARLRAASGALEGTATTLRSSSSPAGWIGNAAFAYGDMAISQADAAGLGNQATHMAAEVLTTYASALREAQTVCRRALHDARQADHEARSAERAAAEATATATAKAEQASAARLRAHTTEASGGVAIQDHDLAHRASTEATQARDAAGRNDRAASAAQGRVADAVARAARATTTLKTAARTAGQQLAGLSGSAPKVATVNGVPVGVVDTGGRPATVAPLPLPSPPPAEEKEEDKGGGIGGWIHGGLDIVGFVPVVGTVADIGNGLYYAAEGDGVNAGLSMASAVPIVGDGLAAGKMAYKGAKAADEAIKLADDAGDAARLADGAGDVARGADGVTGVAKGADEFGDLPTSGDGLALGELYRPDPRYGPVMKGGKAADGSRIEDVMLGDHIPISARPVAGQDVHRVYGQPTDANGPVPIDGDRFAQPDGHSWTPDDPHIMGNPRDHLGLPDVNAGRFSVSGKLTDPSDVTVRTALPLDATAGGGREYLIGNPGTSVHLTDVDGVSPSW